MKLLKLDARGVAHHFVLALVVVGLAVGGTYAILATHADTVNYTNGKIWQEYYTINDDGTGKTYTAYPSNENGGSAVMSPDGTEVAFQTNLNAPVQVGLEKTNETDISNITYSTLPLDNNSIGIQMSWSPDGQWLLIPVYSSETISYWLMHPDGSDGHQIPNLAGNSAAWMPDSQSLAFTKDSESSKGSELCTIALDGTNQQCNLLAAPVSAYVDVTKLSPANLSISPDGQQVAFVALSSINTDPSATTTDVYTVNLDGSNLVQVSQSQTGQQTQATMWSPDGKLIGYVVAGGPNPGLHIMNTDGSNDKQITTNSTPAISWQRIAPDPTLPVTAPVDPVVSASCSINGVPQNPIYGSTIAPTVTVTNTGNQVIAGATIQEDFGTSNGQGQGSGGSTMANLPDLAPGATFTGNLYKYKVVYSSSTASHGSYDVSSSNSKSPSFGCSADFTLPTVPATYKASCTINDVPTTAKQGTSFSPSITVTNSGNTAITPGIISFVDYTDGSSYFKNTTLSTIAPGKSVTKALGTYKVTNLFSDSASLLAHSDTNVNPKQTADFTCIKRFSISVPTINSVTINPADWQSLKNASVTNDGSHGKVVRINGGTAKNYSAAGILGTRGKSTKQYPDGTPLTKLQKFTEADLGRSATICVVVRTDKGSKGATFGLSIEAFAKHTSAGTAKEHGFTASASYSKKCFDFTIVDKQYYVSTNGPQYAPATVWVANTSYDHIYVDSVTLTLN